MGDSCCSCGDGLWRRLLAMSENLLMSVPLLSRLMGLPGRRWGTSTPVPVQLRVVIAPGERNDVDRCADPGGFENVRGSVDVAQVDRDVARESDNVAGKALVPAD